MSSNTEANVKVDRPPSDVFVSYKREERARVLPLIQRLRDLGLTVWFDANLEAGTQFDEEILNELAAARAHLVCWTRAAVESRWIRSEAAIGAGRSILLPVFLEACQPRPPFNIDHIEDLADWDGSATHEGWLKVLARLGQLTGRGAALRRFWELGLNPDGESLRAFVAAFPTDHLARECRAKALSLGMKVARERLVSELGIDETALPSGNEQDLLRDLESAKQTLAAQRAESHVRIQELGEQLEACRADSADARSAERSVLDRLESQGQEHQNLVAEFDQLKQAHRTLQATFSEVEGQKQDLARKLHGFETAPSPTPAVEEQSHPTPPRKTLLRDFTIAALLLGGVAWGTSIGVVMTSQIGWYALYTLSHLAAGLIGAAAAGGEVAARALPGAIPWLRIATRASALLCCASLLWVAQRGAIRFLESLATGVLAFGVALLVSRAALRRSQRAKDVGTSG
jgi:hypothetical protein